MAIRDGSLKVQGPIAVVPQQAWIFNGTVKANIIFGMEFSQEKVIPNICHIYHWKINLQKYFSLTK